MRQGIPDCRNARFLSSSLSIAILAMACIFAPPLTRAQGTGVRVYEGARLITGDGSAPIADSVIVVSNGQFTAVGRKGQIAVPAGAARVDLTGKTVMPAIVDAHKHVSVKRDELVDQLEHFAYYGVGAVMSLGQDTGDVAFQVRAQTLPNAARLRTAGRGIAGVEEGRPPAPYWIKTAEEGRKAVRELAEKKVDIVKIWVDDRDHTVPKVTPEQYAAIIDEAHKHGLRTISHIFTLDDAKSVFRAGIDAFAHSVRDKDIDDEFVNMMKSRPNMILDPNLPDRGVKVDRSWLRDSMTADEFQKVQASSKDDPKAAEFFGIQSRNLKRLNAAGIRVALGTDGNITWAAHEEMEDMVLSGMTPSQVLVAATRNAAMLMQLKDAGTIEKDKSADFLVLDANPLDDITNTRKINAVYLRGAEVDRAALRAKWTGSH